MKRKLNNEELKFCQLKINELIADMENLQYQCDYLDLMLTKGLRINYANKEKEMKHTKKEYEQQLRIMTETITTLKDQIKNGVEIKDKSKKEVK